MYKSGKLPPGSIRNGAGAGAGAASASKTTVVSRLFSSNPTARTVFDDSGMAISSDQQSLAEAVAPSNAPLSPEAASFHALGLPRRLAEHLSSRMGLKAPTAVQKEAVPALLGRLRGGRHDDGGEEVVEAQKPASESGKEEQKLDDGDSDAFIQAETGSGKTLAYLLPIVARIMALTLPPDDDRGKRRQERGTVASTTTKKIHRNSGLFAVVLSPTRELCRQIATVLEKLLRCAPWLVSSSVTGGESKHSEKSRLRKGVNILVATPGRLADHLDNTRVLDLSTVRWLVLDEGDRLMEMGFEAEIRAIVARMRKETTLRTRSIDGVPLDTLPKRRVTVLCSATMRTNVQRLGEISLVDAVHITAGKGAEPPSTVDLVNSAKGEGKVGGRDVAKAETAKDEAQTVVFAAPTQLKQTFLVVPAKLRLVTLIALLKSSFARKGTITKAIVFISCADSVDFHFDLLKSGDQSFGSRPESVSSSSLTANTVAPAAYITSPANPRILLHRLHGSLAQNVRTATLASFSSRNDASVLVTTDVSSRGLDVPSVDLVVEYDPAFSAAEHVHRVGRTARAGRPGKAVCFLMPGCEEGYVGFLSSGGSKEGRDEEDGDGSERKHSAAPAAAVQSYEEVLRQGFLATAPIQLPRRPTGDDEDAPPEEIGPAQGKTVADRAEALQLHLEQRLLRPANSEESTKVSKPDNKASKPKKTTAVAAANPLLTSARQAFRSHVRAYATHVREERRFFDLTQLHLGHTAKSFALREAPTGIGGGPVVRKRPSTSARVASGGKKTDGAKAGDRDGDDVTGPGGEEAAKKMRAAMKNLMNEASEFNIG